MPQPFEATDSWCYRFARYDAIPAILAMPEVVGGLPFRLVDLSHRFINQHLTAEEQRATFLSAKAQRVRVVGPQLRWYIPFIAENTHQLIRVGGGLYRLPDAEDVDQDELMSEALDAAIDEDVDGASDLGGWLYAFTFKLIKKENGPYPIKIGLTTNDVKQRVEYQCRQSAIFEKPDILKSWQVKNVAAAERAVHNVLRYRGRWRAEAPGTEWFDTTLAEIESIVAFLENGKPE